MHTTLTQTLTKNSAMAVSSIGAMLAISAAVYVFIFPNEQLGRGVVTLFALFTVLIACAYVYTTFCVREGKCIAWSYVYAGLTLVMGILSVVYAYMSRIVTPAFLYPNSEETLKRFISSDFMYSPAEQRLPSRTPSVASMSQKPQKKKKKTPRSRSRSRSRGRA
jgi:ABC-type Fe3+-siderophore transport system permease subunit